MSAQYFIGSLRNLVANFVAEVVKTFESWVNRNSWRVPLRSWRSASH